MASCRPDRAQPPLLLVKKFAYDELHDVLYAATSGHGAGNGVEAESGTVYSMHGVLQGKRDWSATGAFKDRNGAVLDFTSISALTVDRDSGNVYAASGKHIWVSVDLGATWDLFYEGVKGEMTHALLFEPNKAEMAGVTPDAVRQGLIQAARDGDLWPFERSLAQVQPFCGQEVHERRRLRRSLPPISLVPGGAD